MNRSALATFSLATAVAVMTLGYANPSYAAKPCIDDDTHPSCKNDDSEGDGASFDVTITGMLGGGSAANYPWAEGYTGKNGIGINGASSDNPGTLTGMENLKDTNSGKTLKPSCFPGSFENEPHDDDETSPPYELQQAIIKPGKKGRAEATFWFHGQTFDPLPEVGLVRVLYVLKLFGDFNPDKVWPGAQTLNMNAWELKIENEGKTIKNISCQGEGTDDVWIYVTDAQ